MKKFTKLFLSCAAVAALSTAIGVSAMAADITGDVKGTFDETAKTVTISNANELGADSGTQVTFLVFKGAADTDISADSVKGIDQGTAVQPTNNGLKSDVVAPAEGQPQDTYTVKVGYYKGGTFTVKSGTFKLGEAAASTLIGDTNLDEDIDLSDATVIVNHVAEIKTITDATALIAADVNYDEDVDLSDATCIVNYVAELSGTGHAGETK